MSLNAVLFVYGTLLSKTGISRVDAVMASARRIGPAWVAARLYDLSAYPGAVLSEHREDRLHGMSYRLKAPRYQLRLLDDYELAHDGAPWSEYRRCLVDAYPLFGDDDSPASAWMYVLNKPPRFARQVKQRPPRW